MRRLVGYDLNGWRDLAVRNWPSKQPEQEGADNTEGAGEGQKTISGGIGGVVVRLIGGGVEGGNSATFMGGAQACLSPHGLGPGWGEVGAPERRTTVREILDRPAGHVDEIAAALKGMVDPATAVAGCRGQTTAVLSIPDTPICREQEQEQEVLLQALRKLRVAGSSLLVWRPVLACLAAIAVGKIDGAFKDRVRVGIVSHDAGGLTGQCLRIRKHKGLLTPERSNTGQQHDWGTAGLEALRRRALDAMVAARQKAGRVECLESARILVPLALGEGGIKEEAVRLDNGDWEVITPTAPPAECLPPVPPCLATQLQGCEIVLIETPAAGALRCAFKAALSAGLPDNSRICLLDHDAVAHGALVAAGRVARGVPVYFDFLPQICTIVQNAKQGARSHKLLPDGAVLPAGRIYRSEDPALLRLLTDTDRIKIYLQKELEKECRLAEVGPEAGLDAPAERDVDVALYVEQQPAAGRARLTLMSDAFPVPLRVDWDGAEKQEKIWDDLITTLKRVPNPIVLRCHVDAWQGWQSVSLEEELQRTTRTGRYDDWELLADLVSSAVFPKRYPVSSTGEVPKDLDEASVKALDSAISAAEAHVRARLKRWRVHDNTNDSLRFLTWTFRRCPPSIVALMVDAMKQPPGSKHPFRRPGGVTLLHHGLGRVVRDDATRREIFDYLMSTEEWNSNHLACAAHLVSRSEGVPKFLDRREIGQLARIIIQFNKEAIGKNQYRGRFTYAPFLMVGLLRYRLVDLDALLALRDPLAQELLCLTMKATRNMKRQWPVDYRRIKFLEDACDYLKGEGRNPDILSDFEDPGHTGP